METRIPPSYTPNRTFCFPNVGCKQPRDIWDNESRTHLRHFVTSLKSVKVREFDRKLGKFVR
jgi:hypothetical protein